MSGQKRTSWLSLALLLGLLPCAALTQPSESALPDSPAPVTADHGGGLAPQREVSWKSLPRDFLHDQKDIWLFPFQVARGHHVVPTLAVVGVTGGLIFADPHIMRHLQDTPNRVDKINDIFDPLISTGYIVSLPVAMLGFGYARHDSYQVQTGILAAEAYGDSAIVDLAIKAVTRRQRPSDVAEHGSFEGTFFNGNKSPLKGSSFPSGHSAAAFSVATVIAERYHNHRWVPWLAYGLASAVSLSRVTSKAHFPSDVFLGGALGYTVAKYEVLRPRMH